jgi:hypothetical protein
MKRLKRFQIRGVPGHVERVSFDGRIVDYWSPQTPTRHLLIAHDGQNIFDIRTATRYRTWKMAQSAIRVSEKLGLTPPIIMGIFHSRSNENPLGRILDLAPEDPYQNGIPTPKNMETTVTPDELQGNKYLHQITDQIAPTISKEPPLLVQVWAGSPLSMLWESALTSSLPPWHFRHTGALVATH